MIYRLIGIVLILEEEKLFDRRVSQMYYTGVGCLVLTFILLQFTSSIFVGILFIVGLLTFAAASNAKFQE